MYCPHCGCEINGEFKFCYNCGQKNSLIVNSYQHNDIVKNEGEYNREVLKQYLSDVRALECIKQTLENKINDIDSRIERLAIPSVRGSEPNNNVGIDEGTWIMFGFGVIVVIAAVLLNFVGQWLFDSNVVLYIGLIIAAIVFVWGIICIVSEVSEGNSRVENWKKMKQQDDERVAQEQIEKDALVEIRADINDEYNELLELLDKCYSVNVVPQQFRNLYAVYYLCEFILTSNESFSNALLQCNLDEIKQQLYTVIENQREIIVNQAIMIAQNEQIITQNNRSLKHYAKIESNTERAAQYAQIAANNAEACAWIGVANYISN